MPDDVAERLRILTADGVPVAEIARQLGCARDTVRRAQRRLGIATPKPTPDSDRGPTPAEQLRTVLATLRDERLAFDEAWSTAVAMIEWPADYSEREAWKRAVGDRDIQAAWRRAFARTADEPAEALAALATVVDAG